MDIIIAFLPKKSSRRFRGDVSIQYLRGPAACEGDRLTEEFRELTALKTVGGSDDHTEIDAEDS